MRSCLRPDFLVRRPIWFKEIGAQTPGPRGSAAQAAVLRAAGAGVGQFGATDARHAARCLGLFDVPARTGAGIGLARVNQLVECVLIKRTALRLP